MFFRTYFFIIAWLLSIGWSTSAAAVKAEDLERSKARVKTFVKRAIAFVKEKGIDEAIKEFKKNPGPFASGETYIFITDFNGKLVVQHGHPEKMGEIHYGMKGLKGEFPVQRVINTAKDKGKGFVSYYWKNPSTNQIECKTTYVERFSAGLKNHERFAIGSGFYRQVPPDGKCDDV
jgi:cytochrome c